MCEPTTLIAGSMMAAGAATSMIAANNARQVSKGNENAMKNAQDDVIIQNRKRATTDYLRDVRLEELQSEQENEAVMEKTGDIAKSTIEAKGTAIAGSAERGIAGGRSLDTILADFDFQQNNEIGRLRINQAMKDSQHVENAEGYGDQFTARASAVQPYIPRSQPPVDYFTPIFGLAGGMVQGGMLKAVTGNTSILGGMGTKRVQPTSGTPANDISAG